jgi:hypothetical protein
MESFNIVTRYGVHYTLVKGRVEAAGGKVKVLDTEKGVPSRYANRLLKVTLPDTAKDLAETLKRDWPDVWSNRDTL